MSKWRVDSYHINIGVGDSAIHILARETGMDKAECDKAVYIDGGGDDNAAAQIELAVDAIRQSYENTKTDPLRFDVVIVTHWDLDHYGGINSYLKTHASTCLRVSGSKEILQTKMFCPTEKFTPPAEGFIKMGKIGNIDRKMPISVGPSILGTDFFADFDKLEGVYQPGRVQHLKALFGAKPTKEERPAMFCLACDMDVIGPNLNVMEDEYSCIWRENITKSNQSSIAAIIAWPGTFRVSHYFAGDLNWQRECEVFAWLNQTLQAGDRIPSMKASHHGSCSSNPPRLIMGFKPDNIIISAGNKHNHPDWELMMWLAGYAKDRMADLPHSPVLLTNWPYWMNDGVKVTQSMFNLGYWLDTATGINHERQRKINRVKNLMRHVDNYHYKYIENFLSTQIKPTAKDVFQELVSELNGDLVNIVADHTGLIDDYDRLYIRVTSRPDLTYDGVVHLWKKSTGLEYRVKGDKKQDSPQTIRFEDKQLTKKAVETTRQAGLYWDSFIMDKRRETLRKKRDIAAGLSRRPPSSMMAKTAQAPAVVAAAPPAVAASSVQYAYSIWGSVLVEEQGAAGQKLTNTNNLNAFVCDLADQAIRLTGAPQDTGSAFDPRDTVFQWMKWTLQATDIKAFGGTDGVTGIVISTQKGLVFDTRLAKDAIDCDPAPTSLGLLPGSNGTVMVFGLDPKSALTSVTLSQVRSLLIDLGTMQDSNGKINIPLHEFVGFADSLKWTVASDPAKLKGRRNALWFVPFIKYKRTLRLAFELDTDKAALDSGPVIDFLAKFWPTSLKVSASDVRMICRQEVWIAKDNASKTTAGSTSTITFFATVTAEIADGNTTSAVIVDVAVELTGDANISLTMQSNTEQNDFGKFAGAIVKSITASNSTVTANWNPGFPDWITQHLYFRRVRLDCVKQDDQTSLRRAQLGIEVKAKLGKDGKSDKNLATYFALAYEKGGSQGRLSLNGRLWFPLPNATDRPPQHFPDWEPFQDLNMLTPNPLESLSLPNLFLAEVPKEQQLTGEHLGHSIDVDGFPPNIPQLVYDARFSLTGSSIALAGWLVSREPYQHGSYDTLPKLDFSELTLAGSYDWDQKTISLRLEFRIELTAPADGDPPRPTCTNQLIGNFYYIKGQMPQTLFEDDTGFAPKLTTSGSWGLGMNIQELQLGMLYQFFTDDSKDLLYDILKDITVQNMVIRYDKADNLGVFKASGELVINKIVTIQLEYEHSSNGIWRFYTRVATDLEHDVLLGDIAASIFGADSSLATGLPDFLANATIIGKGAGGASVQLLVDQHLVDNKPGGVRLTFRAKVGKLSATFVQFHSNERRNTDPPGSPIRYFKLTYSGFEVPNAVPLLKDFHAPFNELGFYWINSNLTKEETAVMEELVAFAGTVMENNTTSLPQSTAALGVSSKLAMTAGFHFVLLDQGKVAIDYPVSKTRPAPRKTNDELARTEPLSPVTPVDSQSKKAPVKKSQGPLSISDLQLHFKDNLLSVTMDAIFTMGPLAFALMGFSIGIDFSGKSISSVEPDNIKVSIEGLATSFRKPPLTLEGGLVHTKTDTSDMYVGGITIGFVPWLFQAAGFYGTQLKPEEYTSVFVYATLRGPLITLEFATISGITGGFGYNVGINIPTVTDVPKFPFLNPSNDESIIAVMEKLLGPSDPRWFFPQDGSMWVAAGLTVTAFDMLDVTAVLIAQWSPQMQFHILGTAIADVPNAKASVKLAHVELGFIATLDTTKSLFSVEAQLSPNSYILHPSCHLSGGFALYYWYDKSSAASAGDWVFTIGGYHSAYQVPANYPRPPRLGISWELGPIAINGEAYFAITSKCCMAGVHIRAVLNAGPLRAWFDAYADFLINYSPFKFQASGGVSVGVSFHLDKWFIHVHIGVEIGATVYLRGPPMGGRVHVDFWIAAFDINFGGDPEPELHLDTIDFYKMALQSVSQQASQEEEDAKPHIYACLGGLLSAGESPQAKEDWDVRGGLFVCSVDAYFAISTSTVNNKEPDSGLFSKKDPIYAKPLHVTSPVTSTLKIEITHGTSEAIGEEKWRIRPIMKCVPAALWGIYDESTDPAGGHNSISDLLSPDPGVSRLHMGMEIQAPEALPSDDAIVPFPAEEAMLHNVYDNEKDSTKRKDTWPSLLTSEQESTKWIPAPADPQGQWKAVGSAWGSQDDVVVQAVVDVWAGLLGWQQDAKPTPKKPTRLIESIGTAYLEAPQMCVAAA